MITGASGLLGANLVCQWSRQGRSVVALSHRHPVSIKGVKSLTCDLLDESQTSEVVGAVRPQWIIHCTAATNVDWCEQNPDECFRLNVEASRQLAARAKAIQARVIYISTDSVFAGDRGGYSESDSPVPVNVYAKSKLLGEQAVARELPGCLIIRTNIYGWNLQPKSSLAEWMLGQLERKAAFPGFQDVIFSPILVNDLADCLLEMMALRLEGVFHVAGSEACNKYEFGQCLADTFQSDRSLVQPAKLADAQLPAPRPRITSLDTSKAARALGHAMPSLQSGLQRFKALRENGYAAELKAAGERGLQECPQ